MFQELSDRLGDLPFFPWILEMAYRV